MKDRVAAEEAVELASELEQRAIAKRVQAIRLDGGPQLAIAETPEVLNEDAELMERAAALLLAVIAREGPPQGAGEAMPDVLSTAQHRLVVLLEEKEALQAQLDEARRRLDSFAGCECNDHGLSGLSSNPDDYCAMHKPPTLRESELRSRLAEAEADKERLDWIEWASLRSAIDAARSPTPTGE